MASVKNLFKQLLLQLLFIVLTLNQISYNGNCQAFLNPERVEQIEEIIQGRDNAFYPPLNGNQYPNPIVFGLIISFGGNFDSSGAVAGVRVALDRINNDTNLLPGYSLHYALSDSQVTKIVHGIIFMTFNAKKRLLNFFYVLQCNRRRAIKALFSQVPYSEPKRIALVGGGCSVASEAIAEVSYHFNITQVRYSHHQ